eukprot:scaffold97537_cov33-Prasinocladus_malaysianus.AAC.1
MDQRSPNHPSLPFFTELRVVVERSTNTSRTSGGNGSVETAPGNADGCAESRARSSWHGGVVEIDCPIPRPGPVGCIFEPTVLGEEAGHEVLSFQKVPVEGDAGR